ncbi:thiamine diphosphokinase [Mesoplasma syrphidae]|uniref:Thiamine diphosphokinase n=2 Tax=Mesoplasma syrphidae TaxID=225999 RepID=A0A2K9CCM0_9MOLU|nr:thiamine diphosphokinase [Mesoplasma syrphidae]AUF83394.1 thiamine diphosphokinase [Mesoplasma syrphidae]
MTKNVLIVTAETNINYNSFNNNENIIIGVERGCLDLIYRDYKIDYAIGDFDKVSGEELELIKSKVNKVEILNCEKDYFDGEEAIIRALAYSPQKIIFVANPTKRYDKNFSIFSLVFKYGIYFMNEDTNIFLIKKGTKVLNFDDYQEKTYVSFFSRVPTLITIEGLKYTTENFLLNQYDITCASNAFIPNKDGKITVTEDIICIMTK